MTKTRTEAAAQIVEAHRNGTLYELLGYTPARIDALEQLAQRLADGHRREDALVVARGVLALDPSRGAMQTLIDTLAPAMPEER